jgi:hypothetical protein
MSYQITLNTWSGANKVEAAQKFSKVFRTDDDKSMTIVDRLCQGQPWRFDQRIPDHQADIAFTFLRGLGFAVDIQSVEGEIEPILDWVADEEIPEQAETHTQKERTSNRFKFQGQGRTLFGITFLNLIKTVFTLGIYQFWAKTNVRQYIWSQTLFAGDRFSYHGTGKELLLGAMLFITAIVLMGSFNTYV